MELTETGDEDFPPDHAVAYCGECDAMVAFRSLNPLSDWLCDLGDRTELVTTPHDAQCPNCEARHVLPTLGQMLEYELFAARLKQLMR